MNVGNVSSNFLKSLCAQNFFCATFYLNSSKFGMTCMKYVEKHFWRKNLCVLQVFLCTLVSRPVCDHTCAHLRGNIERGTLLSLSCAICPVRNHHPVMLF